jgi:hypothetical protein
MFRLRLYSYLFYLFISFAPRRVMPTDDVQIDFNVPAALRKWPSLDGQRFKEARHPGAYLLVEGTLDECIREFMTKPASQRHLYEIHTVPQQPLVSAVMSPEHIVELARLRDFLS